MSSPLRVVVSPKEARVFAGSTATFTCRTEPELHGTAAATFSWEAAVQIANETRYRYDDDRRRTVHITDVQVRDNQTDVACSVSTPNGRRQKARAKIIVQAADTADPPLGTWIFRQDDAKIPQTTTARPVRQVSNPSSTARKISTASTVGSAMNLATFGVALGGAVFFLLLMTVNLYFRWTSKRDKIGENLPKEKVVLSEGLNEVAAVCQVPTDKTAKEGWTETCAGNFPLRRFPDEDLRPTSLGHSASFSPLMGFETTPVERNRASVVSSYGTYESLFWGANPPTRIVGLGQPGWASSLPANYTSHSLATTASLQRHSCARTELARQLSNPYENVRAAPPKYENCPTRNFTGEVTYADLDFATDGDGLQQQTRTVRRARTDQDSTEYAKVLQILSVSRSRRGSTTVKVIQTENLID